jgi:hypothetical protein
MSAPWLWPVTPMRSRSTTPSLKRLPREQQPEIAECIRLSRARVRQSFLNVDFVVTGRARVSPLRVETPQFSVRNDHPRDTAILEK